MDEAVDLRVARGLWYGTADPHGVGDVDRAPRSAGTAPFSVHAHLPASHEELLVRPFPEANVAPVTEPLPAQQTDSQQEPPLVTHEDQVVPAEARGVVRRWMRQLRRCLRAARRGDTSLARRLRPPDLFLPHEENSMPETAAWNWDLTPLDRGLPATPHPVSGEGCPPDTGVLLQAWRDDSMGFTDRAIVDEVSRGVSDDSECMRGTLLCAPHVGALRCYDVAVGKLQQSVEAGYATQPHALPCWPLRTCPYSVVDESVRAGKPKFRMTTDLSWPHPGMLVVNGRPVDAVNYAMDRSKWPANRLVRVREVAEACGIMRGDGSRGLGAWSIDCEAFYRAVGRQRSELWRNGVWCIDGVSLDKRCCFGDASAATKCARISNYLVFQMRRALAAFDMQHPTRDVGWLEWQAARQHLHGDQTALFWLAMYIDDAAAVSADDLLFAADGTPVMRDDGVQMRRAQAHFDVAREVLERYGWRSAPSKEQLPSMLLEVLGVEIDLRRDELRLSPAKRDRYGKQVAVMQGRKVCDRAEWSQMVGRLQFGAQCFPYARQHLNACWRVLRSSFRLNGDKVLLPMSVQRELDWWALHLERGDEVRWGGLGHLPYLVVA